jgi:hypothetical protein
MFREFAPTTLDLPSLAEAARSADPVRQRRTAAYLLTATHVAATMERRPDVLDGEDVYLGAGLQSDGDWYWRSDLAHYVMKYNVELEPEFYAHAASFLWSPGVLEGQALVTAGSAIAEALGRPRSPE